MDENADAEKTILTASLLEDWKRLSGRLVTDSRRHNTKPASHSAGGC